MMENVMNGIRPIATSSANNYFWALRMVVLRRNMDNKYV